MYVYVHPVGIYSSDKGLTSLPITYTLIYCTPTIARTTIVYIDHMNYSSNNTHKINNHDSKVSTFIIYIFLVLLLAYFSLGHSTSKVLHSWCNFIAAVGFRCFVLVFLNYHFYTILKLIIIIIILFFMLHYFCWCIGENKLSSQVRVTRHHKWHILYQIILGSLRLYLVPISPLTATSYVQSVEHRI